MPGRSLSLRARPSCSRRLRARRKSRGSNRPSRAVEVVDPSERISGNATAGVLLVQVDAKSGQERDEVPREDDKIGSDRLWAFLSEPVPPALKLRISSIDGRYYAEVDYPTVPQQPGWVALDLSLNEFAFLEKNYDNPMNEIAALLSAGDGPRFYPVRWGASHRGRRWHRPARNTDRCALPEHRARASVRRRRWHAGILPRRVGHVGLQVQRDLRDGARRSAFARAATARTSSKASRCFAAPASAVGAARAGPSDPLLAMSEKRRRAAPPSAAPTSPAAETSAPPPRGE